MLVFNKYNKKSHFQKFLVYTIYKEGILFYIGSTKNADQRFRQHIRYRDKDTVIFVLECESEEKMHFIEAILINKLDPKGNKQRPKVKSLSL